MNNKIRTIQALVIIFATTFTVHNTAAASTQTKNAEKQPKNSEKKSKTQSPSTQKKNASAPDLKKNPLAGVQEKYKNVKTLTAEFTQKLKNATLGTTKESSGRIYIKRPNKFRWETHKPEASILVGNGKKAWFYTAPFREGEKGQVMVKRAADVQSQLAIDLLSGQSESNKDFKIKDLKDRLSLTPLKASGDIEHIELYIEKPTNLVYKLVLFTRSGNETELTLKDVNLSPKLNDTMFDFVPPPNTEEIQ